MPPFPPPRWPDDTGRGPNGIRQANSDAVDATKLSTRRHAVVLISGIEKLINVHKEPIRRGLNFVGSRNPSRMTSALITKIKRTSNGGCLWIRIWLVFGVCRWNYETSLQNATAAEPPHAFRPEGSITHHHGRPLVR